MAGWVVRRRRLPGRGERAPVALGGHAGDMTEQGGEGEHVQVHTTTDSRELALKIARSAVEARLAACAQVVGPIASTYRWQGFVEQADEWLILLKTTRERFDGLAEHIRGEHTYETPEILAFPVVAGSEDYLQWISAETTDVS
jgi:periplasmic divalent cation tolerance protein